METSAATRTGVGLFVARTHDEQLFFEWAGSDLNSRPGSYLLQDAINPWPPNEIGFYLEEVFIPWYPVSP